MQTNVQRRGRGWRNNRKFINGALFAIALFLIGITFMNVSYLRQLSSRRASRHSLKTDADRQEEREEAEIETLRVEPDDLRKDVDPPPGTRGGIIPTEKALSPEAGSGSNKVNDPDGGEANDEAKRIVEERPNNDNNDDVAEKEEENAIPRDSDSDKASGLKFNKLSFDAALDAYYRNLKAKLSEKENPKQNTKSFLDVSEIEDDGILLPHDPSKIPDPKTYEACDNRDANFTPERDTLCQQYMSDINNMRSIKALGSLLYSGRTIKFKVFYRHGGLQGVVKVSQQKFFFEAASEYLAYSVDRSLNFSYVPPTSYVSLPVDYMRAAAASVSPFFTQWFEGFIPEYKYTQSNLVVCPSDTPYTSFLASHNPRDRAKVNIQPYETKCSQVAVQLWMKDVHSALDTVLAVPHEYSEKFARKYMRPYYMLNETKRNPKYTWPPVKAYRQQAIGDLCDRMIFDFLIGNTDRGMNDHNNFAYGGCTEDTECRQPAPENRLKSPPKYAFIDHGSSFYSHKEPEGNPFAGNHTSICRYRRSTYERFWHFSHSNPNGYLREFPDESRPFIHYTREKLPKGLFNVIHLSVFKKVQERMEKVVGIIQDCINVYGADEVFSV